MLNIDEIKNILPHRYPFLLVDRVTNIEKGVIIHAYKNITANEEVFQGHFPGHPIYPGVMIIEGMAQAGGILAFYNPEKKKKSSSELLYFLSIDKAKFRKPVVPGDKLDYIISILDKQGSIWTMNAKAKVNNTLVAEAELKAMVVL